MGKGIVGLKGKHVQRILRSIRMGFYALIILGLLDKYGPLYGYKILALIKRLSGQTLNPSESTIYETLKNLEKDELVRSYWAESELGPPRKYYEITDKGKETLKILLEEVRKIVDVVNKVV